MRTNPPASGVTIAPLRSTDRDRWGVLARGYKTFYQTELPDSAYIETWRRLMDGNGLYGVGASIDDRLVGIVHYLFHRNVWSNDVCYLQDLFVDPQARGKGLGRMLIAHVASAAREAGSARLYWLTQETNTEARMLYDQVAQFRGFIRYDYPLS